MTPGPDDLAARYARAVDRRDTASLVALLVDDAVLVLPSALSGTGEASTSQGSEMIAATIVNAVAHLHFTRHVVHQQVIDVDGDTATGETHCTAHHVYRTRDGYRDNRIAVRYLDSYVLRAGRWQFGRRQLVVDYSEDVVVTVPE